MQYSLRTVEAIAQKTIPFPVKLFLRKLNWRFFYLNLKIRNFARGRKTSPKVFCPISETFFDEFVPLFKAYDPGLSTCEQPRISPDSGARDGLRLQWLYLKNETELFKSNIRLLHFGPEYGFYKRFITMDNIRYFPVDKNNRKYSRDVGYADLAGLDFQTDAFDMIICNHILEHVDDDKQAIREMYRVLKPGGTAIITVPIDHSRSRSHEDASITNPKDREREFGQWDHLRYYGLDFHQKLASKGFTVKTVYYAKTFSSEDVAKFGLVNEPVFVCQKPLIQNE
ncbi:MAG: class I SAM-dependent methyltransferase [Desulfobacteraceae bacterium]|nr:class I SAM-dependent methyltransferase [Desulfobacteraceae bacterium]MBC2755123.1 class I SAM-dependent methyltransferase [Desulfobacteraceae bacterium]